MTSDQENRSFIKSKAVDHQDTYDERKLFLQAFEKPTQMYRFLRKRHLERPIFLHRTLSYMKHLMSRSHKSREGFKVDSLLDRVLRTRANINERKFANLVIVGLGVFDEKFDAKYPATLEVSLVKFCHKKRKDQIAPVSSVPIGKCELPVNSNDQPNLPVVLAVPKHYFSMINGHLVKYYSLQFKVTAVHSQSCNSEIKSDVINGDDNQRPSYKKRKLIYSVEYQRDLTVVDRNAQCVLTDGEYQLVLDELTAKNPKISHQQYYSNQTSSWETLQPDKSNDSVVFGKGPLLVFHLFWTDADLEGITTPGRLILRNSTSLNRNDSNRLIYVHSSDTSNLTINKTGLVTPKASLNDLPLSTSSSSSTTKSSKTSNSSKITFRFLANGSILQQTRSSQDLKCPWCSLKCKIVMSLMHHFKNCHPRFNFLLIPDTKGHKVDITVNEDFDDSSKADTPELAKPLNDYSPTKHGPGRHQIPITHLIYFRKRAPQTPQFIRVDDPEGFISVRPYVTGHCRQYYRSRDCLPLRPEGLDEDSEAEIDPEWARTKTQLMIDEFTDVNEGEKGLMKLWNLHSMKHGYVGDCEIPRACDDFVENYWKEILSKNLYKNFILHLNNLFDFGILPARSMRKLIQKMNQYRNQSIHQLNSE